MENTLELKTINELNSYRFFIPSYQRGYRWTKNQVEDLLNDISDFQPRLIGDTDEKTWYCLQPIVLKLREDNSYEVIDGQQRLTTIYLCLFYLNQDFIEARRDKLFSLNYETRHGSEIFLSSLDEEAFNKAEENIDYYYISEAYKNISNWFDKKEQDSSFDKGNFRSKLKFNSKVIWYQSYENDPIAIFTRINIGKIPLTNAELIKALFLNSSNFEKGDSKKLKQKQFEIATEWDNIELSLQNDRFWFFLNKEKQDTNRIEFIFNLMNPSTDPGDKYSTFRFFSQRFTEKNQETIEKNWSEVKRYYQRFNEWFNERDLYHKIGYLHCTEQISISDLYKKSSELSKTDFKNHLDEVIKEGLRNINLDELQYGDKEVRKVLLLYNILTMLKNEQDNSYFPFDIFKNERWDIEHITSVKDTLPDNKRQWLDDALPFIDISCEKGKNIKLLAENLNIENEDDFKKIFEAIVSHFNSRLKETDINDISNLTLLDSETNRGYKNAVFPLKRKTIISRDKNGTFIPLCTKNVFLKYFSDYPPKISFWTQEDKDNYLKDLHFILDTYMN